IIRNCVSFVVDEVLAAGASCSTEVEKSVSVGSTGLGAAAARTIETRLGGGFCMSPELIVPGVNSSKSMRIVSIIYRVRPL
nr:hypothetical protein [Tanacetum cinerariifolium]